MPIDVRIRHPIRLLLMLAALLAGYLRLLRPWHLRWGASAEEVAMPLTGDELVAAPTLVSTRAVTIAARPGAVWPWLVQIGQGRGGFYTYDWIENLIGLDIHSAERVLREHQQLAVGDTVSLGADGVGLVVEAIAPERHLVLRELEGNWSWAFVLEPEGAGRRLIVRDRWTVAEGGLAFRAVMALIDPASFVMERGMLLGIKRRAERLAAVRSGP
jgi:hypothetical protein